MANQYNSYYLYQKYEKRGNQDWLPCYPNIFSVDGDGTMPLVLKQENDQACGYIPPGETMYRWVNLDPSVDYYCLECGTDGLKVSGTYGSGDTYSVNCDSSTTLVSGDTIQISDITYARVGYCVDTIGDRAFMARGSLSGVSIPTNITSIGASAFTSSLSLIECVIPETVTSIGACAFKDCVSLRNTILWDTITSIGVSAFTNCDYLIGVNIPTGLTAIPGYCFKGCGALSEVTIPDNITSIGNGAFSGCTGLISITVNATTPPTLGSNVFDSTNGCPIYVPCESLFDYFGASGWSSYSTRIHGIPPCDIPVRFAATYSSGSSYIAYCASSTSTTLTSGDTRPSGYEYSAMTTAEIGDCITNIGDKSFSSCTNLESVTIGSGVTSIGYSAFHTCSGLTSIDIPSGVTSIGNYAFSNCKSFTSITVNATTPPTLGGSYVFFNTNNCPIYVPCESVGSYKAASGWSSYANRITCGTPPAYKLQATYLDSPTYTIRCDSPSATLTTGDTTPDGYEYSAMTSADIGSCVTTIDTNAFSGCRSLTSVTIPDSVTSIGWYAFSNCTSLTSITIPNSVTIINWGAFWGSSGLTSINIPDSVTRIFSYAFRECSSITSVTIGSGITIIDGYAFYECSGLTSVTINATTPPTLESSSAFYNTNNCPIYVPYESVDTYKAASKWSDLASRIQAITS